MRAMGGWIALTPELPAKLLFGRHVWDCAQHADLWGRRLPELRAHAQESEPASEAVVGFVALLESPEGARETPERLAGVYRVLKPHLVTVYERHLAATNPIYEPPTRRILERVIDEERRHVAAAAVVLPRMLAEAGLARRADDWAGRLTEALAAARGITGDVEAPLIAPAPAPVDAAAVAQDLVTLPPPFDPRETPEDLAAAVSAHGRALETGDLATALAPAPAEARDALAAELGRLVPPYRRSAIVALARIGGYRMVRLRLEGERGSALVQERWTPSDAGWRVVAAEVVRAEPAAAAP